VCFQSLFFFWRPSKASSCFFKRPLQSCLRLLFCECSASHTCRVASSPLSLSPNIFVLFSTASACTRSHPAELRRSLLPRFLLKATEIRAQSQTGSHLGRDDPKRCNQIEIMPFVHTSFRESESARPKATALYVYNMLLFLVTCLLNRWQRASSAGCL
jgi:hypothetical protein